MKTKYSVDTMALKVAMIQAGYNTNISFAKDCGVSDRTVSAILNGANPTYSVMCKMVSVLKLGAEQAGKIFFNDNLRVA